MASRVLLAAEAERDLAAAVSYLCDALFLPTAAASLLDDYDEVVATLSEFPEAFPLSEEPRLCSLGIRKASFNTYVALYRPEGDGVVIEHIFHQKQDYARLV